MKLSIIASFYNEKESLNKFYNEIKKVLDEIKQDYEFIFINDGSVDNSKDVVEELCKNDIKVKLINTSRRFGNQECIFAGLKYMSGDAAVIIDTDLQDPPHLIKKMIEKFNEGYEVINMRRSKRHGENPIKLFLTKYAYKLINISSEIKFPENAGIFKLVSKKVVSIVLNTNDHDPYIRGLFNWVGFKQFTIDYERAPRLHGETKFNIFKTLNPWNEFVRGITSFSMVPLYLPLFIGFFMSLFSFILIIYFFLQKFIVDDVTSGWTSLILSILFLGGLILIILGIIGIYIGKMFEILRGRPKYIVESTMNIETNDKNN